jgi:hypothetical protein
MRIYVVFVAASVTISSVNCGAPGVALGDGFGVALGPGVGKRWEKSNATVMVKCVRAGEVVMAPAPLASGVLVFASSGEETVNVKVASR